MKKIFFLLTAGFIWSLSACEQADDYGLRYEEPVVKLKFSNKLSLNSVNAIIAENNQILEMLDTLETDSAAAAIEVLEERQIALEYQQTRLTDGWYMLDTLWDVQTGNYITFEDSAKVFDLPLSMYQDSTIFYVVIDTLHDTLQVNYELRTFERDSTLGPAAYKLQLVDRPIYEFDSVGINKCEDENCLSNERIITLSN